MERSNILLGVECSYVEEARVHIAESANIYFDPYLNSKESRYG